MGSVLRLFLRYRLRDSAVMENRDDVHHDSRHSQEYVPGIISPGTR